MDAGLVILDMAEADVSTAQHVMRRSVREDFGDAYDPVIHADIDDLPGTYVRPEGAFMLVVVDRVTGDVVATGGMRNGAFDPERVQPQIAHLERRYRDVRTGQIVRVYVLKEHRRRGIARALVQAIIDRARDDAHYERLALHTYPHSPGALPFWLAMGFEVVFDDMDGSRQMYFELPLPPKRDEGNRSTHDLQGAAD